MKLTTFLHNGHTRLGVLDGDAVVDLKSAAPGLPQSMAELLAAGPRALEIARKAGSGSSYRLPADSVRLAAPVRRPPKFLAIGLNYADHVAESGRDAPEAPIFFNKQSTCVVGPGADIHLPRVSPMLDYEGELAFVIGRRCRHVPRERAGEVIAGFTIVNDVSVRDWQMRSQTMTMGKSFDTHGPMGPYLVTQDEVGDPHTLSIKTYVNGELRQDSNTRHMIFDCYAQVEHLSTAFTLEPGDVISTGTPAGVGGAMQPPRFLVAGDTVRIEIEKLGSLQNRVVAEPEDTVRL